MNRRKSNVIFMNEDLYYYSSEDSEDEIDRLAMRSGLNSIHSNFTRNLDGSRNNIINYLPKENSHTPKNYLRGLKRSQSDIRQMKLYKQRQKTVNILDFFTYGYNREKSLILKEKNDFPNIKHKSSREKIGWKLIYELIFIKNKKNKKIYFNGNQTNLSELINNKYMNDENFEKYDNKIEKFKFQIIIDKIKHRMKKKYELNKDKDISIGKKDKNKKIPEILLNLKKNDNNLKNIYKVGISDMDKKRLLPMFINKLKNKFNIYIDKSKYEKRKYFQSLRKHSFKNDKNSKKIKRIRFEVNKKIKTKYSISEDKISNLLKNNIKNIRLTDKRKDSSNIKNLKNNPPLKNSRSLIKNDKSKYPFNHRKTLSFKNKNYQSEIKYNSENNLKMIYFNENELNCINSKKMVMTDKKLELFKNNAKTIINDEVLFKEFKREYPDYEEEIFNLYNNFLLYEKVYDKLDLKNCPNMKKYIDYNHNINNFLSLNNKINLSFNEYEINNKIIENAINLQKIINYFK